MKILAAVDESPMATRVIDAATSAANALDLDVEVLHASRAPAADITHALEHRDVAMGVVGAGRPSSNAHPVGHVALAVITRSKKPLVVVPPVWQPKAIERVLMPFERDEQAQWTVEDLATRLRAKGAEIVGTHVVENQDAPRFWEGAGHHADTWRAEFLARCTGDSGATLDLRYGSPATQVLDAVAATSADAVVLTWRQDLSPGRAEVVRALLAASPVPVVLVPA